MNKTLLAMIMVFGISCSSNTNNPESSRVVASAKDISGTYLGVSKYKNGQKGPNKAATRIYLHEVEGEKGNYHVVLLEYVDLLRMAPSYIISNKLPVVAKKTGFLNSITSKIAAFKASPSQTPGTFEMWPLVVQGDQIVEKREGKPRLLVLSNEETMTGATIQSSHKGDPEEIYFPKEEDENKNGLQYAVAKLTYKKAKLESTWRKNFLPGPYLSQYAKVDDVVLDLIGSGDRNVAEFKLNEAAAKVSKSKREKVFTHKDSAFLKGEFNVTEPLDGMFVFNPVNGDDKTNEIVKGKIGLFIDVFDATKSLNQDVVELALIDSEKPKEFLMYYEHPENGEGK